VVEWFQRMPVGVLTADREGALLFVNGERYEVHPRPAREVDPTGAGDVFAATFLVQYQREGDPWQPRPPPPARARSRWRATAGRRSRTVRRSTPRSPTTRVAGDGGAVKQAGGRGGGRRDPFPASEPLPHDS